MHEHMYVGIAYIPGSNHEEIYRLFELGAKTGAVTFIHNRGNMDDLTVLITRHYLFYNSRTLLGCSTPLLIYIGTECPIYSFSRLHSAIPVYVTMPPCATPMTYTTKKRTFTNFLPTLQLQAARFKSATLQPLAE